MRGKAVPLGPGKADLLAAIRETRSLRRAAASLGMSYMRAWTLVKTMNETFARPVVLLRRGGVAHGGATLTATGATALALYRRMETKCVRAVAPEWRRLQRLLRPRPRKASPKAAP